MFFFVVFSIWAALLAHIFYRTQMLLGLNRGLRVTLAAGLYLTGFAYVPARIMIAVERDEVLASAVAYATSWFIGICSILWTLLVILELASVAMRLATHRHLWKASPRVRVALAAVWWGTAGILGLIGFGIAHSTPLVTHLQVTVPDASARNFVMISDSHLGTNSSENQWRRTLQEARRLEPDIILVVGDLIDDSSCRTGSQARLLREFFPQRPVYITTGNHEFYVGLDYFTELCEELGFRLLRQEVVTVSPGISVMGIDDLQFKTAVEAWPQIEGALLFLTHRPAAAHLVRDRPMTLALAGHTHGGQVLPMVFFVALDNEGFRSGYFRVSEAHLYVSNGTGVWGPPMRLFAPPELVLIEVRPGERFQVELSATSRN
jgi:predicted MPP superfamily phosphohydrolase